eukprot:4068121-Heterocapsa_arctica.AAC.1
MANLPKEDINELSKVGALRMSRKEVLEYIHMRMVTCGNGARQYCMAYIMYEEMGRRAMP